jgi:hypothetical protein
MVPVSKLNLRPSFLLDVLRDLAVLAGVESAPEWFAIFFRTRSAIQVPKSSQISAMSSDPPETAKRSGAAHTLANAFCLPGVAGRPSGSRVDEHEAA